MKKHNTIYRKNKDADTVWYHRLRNLEDDQTTIDWTHFRISDTETFRLERESTQERGYFDEVRNYTEIDEQEWNTAYKRFLEHIDSTIPAPFDALPF